MRFGVCTDPEKWADAAKAGADYIECPLVGLNKRTDAELADYARVFSESPITCEALCILFPGRDIPLVGDGMNIKKVDEYIRGAFRRAVRVGRPSIVVLGSGAARNCPDGFDRSKAAEQLAEVGLTVAKAAADHGLTVVMEALNHTETNMVNSLGEAVEIVRQVGHPQFKILADLYHMQMENEPAEALLACKNILAHTHIATPNGRRCPLQNDAADFHPYFKVLKEIGYEGRMSIEVGGYSNADLAEAFGMMREVSFSN